MVFGDAYSVCMSKTAQSLFTDSYEYGKILIHIIKLVVVPDPPLVLDDPIGPIYQHWHNVGIFRLMLRRTKFDLTSKPFGL